ncbi:T9SS type A sorting domain-containing protein [bacterium]|nr:T9SS type A sorting domain-containing protein [bacterium]MDB3907202.1 T9SS type A sorting domain-containing protein [Crocinitomicaceae bacterium]
MRKQLLKLTFGLSLIAFGQTAQAQCPTILCVSDTTVSTDSAACSAVINFASPLATDTCSAGGFQSFNYTGAQQTWVVPAGVTSINVDASGAQGGSNSATNVNYGGRVQADLPVTPGTTIYIYVGEQPNGLTGGWNGGGNGETLGQGGGGASDIRIGGTTLTDRLIVAGGGGGGGFWSGEEVHGGLGGGLVGGNGYRTSYVASPGGEGGTQAASGNGTCISLNNPAVSGGFGFGGVPSGCGCEGYGGGGGWYGGAGSGNCRGGGGGSSYTDPSATNVIHTQGNQSGHGSITISWNGGSPIVTQIAGLASGSTFPIGTTTNTFTAEVNGTLDTCSFVITVEDTEAPSISCTGNNIEVCEGVAVSIPAPAMADNCSSPTLSYNTSGATTISGSDSIASTIFNPGTTTVWYIATDSTGNQDSCSISVFVNPSPTVTLAPFSVDSLCNYSSPVSLPIGTPTAGSYSGTAVSGGDFDPAVSGDGTFNITYTYSDSLGCTASDSSMIIVHGCANINELNPFNQLSVYPNPSNGVFIIATSTNAGQADFVVTNVDGRLIHQGAFELEENLTIDLSNEPKGYYILQLRSETATKSVTLIKN